MKVCSDNIDYYLTTCRYYQLLKLILQCMIKMYVGTLNNALQAYRYCTTYYKVGRYLNAISAISISSLSR